MQIDTVDYEKGETAMTDYQFKQYEALRDKYEEQARELALLRSNSSTPDKQSEESLTDFQYKSLIKMIYKILKADFDAGKSKKKILADISDLMTNGSIGEDSDQQ